jgi:monoterpene epsilon-lactone hydrolase
MNEQRRWIDEAIEQIDFTRRGLLTLPIMTILPTTIAGRTMAANSPNLAARELPARTLPVPDTVSSALQAVIAAPYPVGWDVIPQTAAQWNALPSQSAAAAAPFIAEIYRRFDIRAERSRIGDVNVFTITPAEIPAANRDCVLLHLHGGGNVLYPGEAGAGEGMLMAGFGRYKVISVGYRMGPDFPFPASLDDATAVWRALLADHDPRRMATFGSSSGGGLTLALMLRAKAEGLPLPAAIAPGTPWVDLTGDVRHARSVPEPYGARPSQAASGGHRRAPPGVRGTKPRPVPRSVCSGNRRGLQRDRPILCDLPENVTQQIRRHAGGIPETPVVNYSAA